MTEMTVRAVRVISGVGMVPIADYAGCKEQQRDQREGNPEYANRLAHRHSGEPGLIHLPLNNNLLFLSRKVANML